MKNYLKIVKHNLDSKQECNIVFIGDSITSAEWVHPNWREVIEYVLKEELFKEYKNNIPSWGIRCFNFGFDGGTTSDILGMINRIKKIGPDISLIMLSRNDMDFGILPDLHSDNLSALVSILKHSNSEVIYSTPQHELIDELNKRYEPYKLKALKRLSKECEAIDLEEEYSKYDYTSFYTFKSEENSIAGIKEGEIDPSHPNVLGNMYIAKIFLKKLFEIEFNPELYLKTLSRGDKYPQY